MRFRQASMSSILEIEYDGAPSVAMYMTLALVPKGSADREILSSRIRAVWRDFVPAAYLSKGTEMVQAVELQAASLRLIMAVLTRPEFPVPIWRILQIRNRITQHSACDPSDRMRISAETKAIRILEKGVEFDVEVKIESDHALILESVSTFYVKGKFHGPRAVDLSQPRQPVPPMDVTGQLCFSKKGVFHFARLTGDYNGVHWSDQYSRRFGFRSAFAHPHRVLDEALAMLFGKMGLDTSAPLQIHAWYKGPIYYGAEVDFSFASAGGETTFALRLLDDPRPAILGMLKLAPFIGKAN